MTDSRHIVLGVTGAIAAYKACELTRLFIRGGYVVHVIMTEHAQAFIAPLTFSTLSGNPVATGMFDGGAPETVKHIDLADEADLVVVAPATANIIAKVAAGIADDLLSTVILATKAPVLFAPSMNVNMYENRITQDNIKRLTDLGFQFVEPDIGWLACGWEGKGRLAEPARIFERARTLLTDQDLSGMKVLVTAGPTREAIDPVRFITNRSTGKMGYAVASRAACRGAQVVLISGPSCLDPPTGVKIVHVESAADMAREVSERFEWAEVVIKAAAVSDFTPAAPSGQKIKKDDCGDTIKLSRTEDILLGLGKIKGNSILVGFAAETEQVPANARKKLIEKNLDMIVANDVSRKESGFAVDTNIVRIIPREGPEQELPLMKKEEVADEILNRVRDLWKKAHR
jgi:phosphopantothenoylcysteine decarboxylase / phosphopantothenate---cysteine ligase